ncbi:MAG TPA: hypothetical protein VGO40_07335 [Longimicrobium sp.]|jgi:hypothetical protein|nr:hypothetical protein [Longimicrobium sp.]
MTDTAAAPALAFRRRSTLERLVLDPELEIGAGGEAVVYGVPGDGTLVAKLYHEPAIERARKLGAMLAHPPAMPEGTATAWPADLLLDGRGRFAGFVMPRAEGPRLFEFYNPVSRRETAGGFHAGRMHRAGRNLAAAFDALHAAGYVVGDVNESNLLVSPIDSGVTLVDADSLQVRDAESGAVFRSRVGKPEFTPPELQGVSFEEVDRTEVHDRFGLAVLLFLLLMEGTHPFAARLDADGEAPPVEERIRRGLFPHASDHDDCHPPRLSPRFDALHPPLQALFVRAFVGGHADPAARPSPAEWRDALQSAESALAVCAANPLHRHGAHLDACPWCERTALLGGRDPFPAPGTAMVRAPRPPRPRRMAAPPMASASPPSPPLLAQYGTRRVLRNLGRPAPSVFGPSGVRNPLVVLLAAVAMLAQGGTLAVIAVVLMVLALVDLLLNGWRQIRGSTVALAVVVLVVVSVLVDLAGYAAEPSPPALPPAFDFPSPAAPSSDAPPADAPSPDEPASAAEPIQVRTAADFMLGTLNSAPVSTAPQTLPDPPAPVAADDGQGYQAPDLDRLPRLVNEQRAASVLASAFARTDGVLFSPDTAVLWLRVGSEGRVTSSQVISSTSRAASVAATASVPYLRFAPGEKDGRKVPAWVSQRMVLVP